MKRRNFIYSASLGASALILRVDKLMATLGDFQIPKRVLGKTGEMISAIGFGGITLRNNGQEFANEIISRSYDTGCRYYDVAPTYGDAEELMGPALKNFRKNSLLACKTQKRDARGAEEEMNASLKKLQTDYFDLYQLHVLKTTEDVEQVFAPGGAMEYITKARDKGKVRYIGFSAHSTDAALLALEKFEFDTIMFPINYSCWMEGDFGPAVYDKALEKGSAVLAIKAFAVRRLQEGEPKQHENMWYFGTEEEKLSRLAFGYTMSKKVSSAIPSGDASYFWKAAEYMKDLPEMDENKLNYLITETKRAEPIFPV